MDNTIIFQEALVFYHIKSGMSYKQNILLYEKLVNITQPLGQIRGKWDRTKIEAIDISALVDIMGI